MKCDQKNRGKQDGCKGAGAPGRLLVLTEAKNPVALARYAYANGTLRTVLRLALAFALAVTPLRGSDISQPEPRLVDLNVVAVDSHGQPVTDLSSDDFEITDGGKQQKIAFFHHSNRAQWQTSTLAHNELSNRSGATIPYATVILFDLMNEGFGTRGYAANQIVHALENLESADYLYLYFLTLDGRLLAVHGFASEQPQQPTQGPWTRQIKSVLDDSMRTLSQQRPVDVDVAGRVEITFRALENLAQQLSRVPGRKNIVWVTDGVPIALGPERSDTGDLVDFRPEIRKLGEALDRSGVAIYPARQVIYGGPRWYRGTLRDGANRRRRDRYRKQDTLE